MLSLPLILSPKIHWSYTGVTIISASRDWFIYRKALRDKTIKPREFITATQVLNRILKN